MPSYRIIFLVLLLFGAVSLSAQTYKIHGKITTTKLEGIGYASIEVKEIRLGTITKNEGEYQLFLEAGKHELVVTMLGYQSQTLSIVVDKDYLLNIILEEDSKNLSEVIVKAKVKDRAEEVVRNVIRNKEGILEAPGPYSYNLYIKATQQDSANNTKKTRLLAPARSGSGGRAGTDGSDAAGQGRNANTKNQDADLAQMAMVEIFARVDQESDNRIKEERTGIKRNGKAESLFYLSATEGNFNFYNNLIKVPNLSSMPFVSPVSYSGLVAYKFKTLKVLKSGKHKIYTISVKPRQMSNATVEGEITITDSAYVILHTRFQFPRFHMPEYDFFEVEQQYNFVDNKAWMITRQHFNYYSKGGRNRKLSGQTTALYSNHQLNKKFSKKHFGNEISATAQEAYEKDSSFWETARVEPLTSKELSFIRYRDSLYRATHTKQYQDSIDKLTNKVTWKKIGFIGQTIYNREKERTWHLPPVTSVFQPFAFGGTRISPSVFYAKTYKSRKNFSLFSHLSYGIRNNDLNGSIKVERMYNPFNRGFFSIGLSRDFQPIFYGDAWINTLKRSNFFLNKKLSLGHGLEIANGLFFYTDFDIAFRSSISNYKTGKLVDSLLGDVLNNNKAIPFESYNAVYGKIRLHFTPKQRFIREPKEKIILGSAWPTFYTMLRKGVPGIFNSKVNFDYLEFGMEQQINVGLAGVSRYNVKTGNFFNKKDLRLVDYQFQRQGDPLFYMNPDEAFQALDSTFPLFNRFYQGHFVHEFNGVMLNKIPLLKKLQLREVGGAGFLFAPERNLRYAEAFAGVERVFKWPFNPLSKFKLGVYVVGSVANQFTNPIQFKVGVTTWDKRRNKWH